VSTPQPAPSTTDANLVLMQQVAVPTFFRKLASDCGFVPQSDAKARHTLKLADMIKAAVDKFVQRRETAAADQVDLSVKVAADAAYEIAGLPTDAAPAQPAARQADDFLLEESVKAAAAAIVDAKIKQAADALSLQTPGAPAGDETETDTEPAGEPESAAA